MQKVTIKIEGLRCEKCSGFVQRQLEALEGTSDVSVTLDPMQATLSYDPDLVSIEGIEAAINNEEKGFSVA